MRYRLRRSVFGTLVLQAWVTRGNKRRWENVSHNDPCLIFALDEGAITIEGISK